MKNLAILTAAVLVMACGSPAAPDEAVRQWIADAEAAVEERDRGSLIDMIADGYIDARGNRRDDIDRLLRLYFLRSQETVLASKIDQLSMHDDSAATVMLTVGVAGTDATLFGFSADAYRFELELELSGSAWKLIGARWGALGEELR